MARFPNARGVLRGINVYIGDGATMKRSMVRKRDGTLIGHAPVVTQLGWCKRAKRPPRYLHPLRFADRARRRASLNAALRRLGREHGIDALVACDGDGCASRGGSAQRTERTLDVLDHPRQSRLPAFNEVAAERLREAATLLAHQGDNPYRVAAYRRAADAVAALTPDCANCLKWAGSKRSKRYPGVGSRIAGGLAELARTGRWTYLERLRGSAEPEDVFCTIPGLGPILAKRLHETLHVETLEQLKLLCTRNMPRCRGNWSSKAGNLARCARTNAGAHPVRSHRAVRRATSRHAA